MNLFVLLSHELLESQKLDVGLQGVSSVISLPNSIDRPLQDLWSNVPPDIGTLEDYAQPFYKWLSKASKGDYVLVQGDFGLTYLIVQYCFNHGLVPMYATTERRHVENAHKEEIYVHKVFRHVSFRKYGL